MARIALTISSCDSSTACVRTRPVGRASAAGMESPWRMVLVDPEELVESPVRVVLVEVPSPGSSSIQK